MQKIGKRQLINKRAAEKGDKADKVFRYAGQQGDVTQQDGVQAGIWTVAQTTTSQAEATTAVTTSGQQAVRTFTVDSATFATVDGPSASQTSSSSSEAGGSSTLDLGSAFNALSSSTDASAADTFSTSASATIAPRTTSLNTLSAPAAAPAAAGLTALAATPNKIVLENQKQGNPQSEWAVQGDGDPSIQGFATQISTNVGGTVDFKIATDSKDYRIEIYRMGYYGGDGARKVATIDKNLTTAQVQPHPIVDYTTGLIDCSNWSVSASWAIPSDATSGIYFAKLVREDGGGSNGGASMIPFIVREDGSTSNIVFQTSDTTWQAYNAWGGASLYEGDLPVDPNNMIGWVPPNCNCSINAIGKATAVSYNRPFVTQTSAMGGTWDFVFGPEMAAVNWLEQNGYDVSYISGVDTTRNGAQLLNHEAFLSVGHDEYWSAEQRANVENARDSGVNLAFWSGNEVYWKVRWETDAAGNAYRTMVSYKETWGVREDPSNISTGTWRDPRYSDPGQEPENSLTGTMFTVDSYRADTITVPYEMSNFRFWRDTSVADLQQGQTYSLVKNLLGYEWDSDVENGYRPAGLINMSLSTVSVESYLRDYGTQIGSNTVDHSLTMYRAESGALVFGAGTVFWSWGLSDAHLGTPTPTDPNVQQAMVNMFADMGIQPMTLQASLVLATQSTDFVKPTSTITSPIIGASFVEGQKVTITGTATDTGGGIVAGVEVSLDGGQSWWKATGRENWTYNWVVQASGNYTIMSRAVDDSLNLETPGTGKTVTVALPTTSSLWSLASKPTTQQATVLDKDSVELGVKFKSSTSGQVTAIRFYKGFYNIGEHTVSLWTADGQLLARGVSTGESLDGWQQVNFATPVTIAANTSYVASYHTNGYYSATNGTFTNAYSNGPLSVEANGAVYVYGSTPTFPTLSPFTTFTGDNYWVDVVFQPSTTNTAPVAVNDSGFSTTQGNALTLAFAALTGNDTDANGDALSITGVSDAVNGTVAINSQNGTVVFTPTAGYTGAASFKYTISDGRGGTSTAMVSLAVNTLPTGVSLFAPGATPTGSAFNDGTGVELGMRFATSASGTISGLKFYKAAGDTGTHTGSIWKADGTLLGRLTFSNETASGWQTAGFANAINIVAGEQYIVSYHSNGRYYATSGYFNSATTSGPLTAPASVNGAGNGLYVYGNTSALPTQTYQAANYWVDVLFNQSAVANSAPVATNDTGYSTTFNTALAVGAAALLANDTDVDGDVLSITGVDQAVNGTVSYNTTTKIVTFTPTTGYSGAASFRYTVSDGKGGTAMATVSLTVNTPTNTAPTANNDSGYTTIQNTALTLAASTLLANDNDPDGDVLSITGADLAVNGTVAYNSTTKAVTFTPTTGYTGAASFRYSISDGRGGTSSATVSFSVAAPAQTVSLLNNGTPSQPSVNDPSGVELGMRFTVSAAGTITGIKYYKGVNDTGTHIGSLWTSGGTLLTSGTFSNETASGWQTLTFTQPVAVAAGTTLVVSYHSNGNYAVTPNYFTSTITNGPLSATGGNNGVYAYGNSSLFPTNSYQASNYWVDVTFQNATGNAPPVAVNDTGFTTAFNTAKVIQASQLLANDTDSNGDTLNITGVSNAVNGTVAYNSTTKAVTFTPTTGYSGAASFSYAISDGNGGTSSANVSLTVNSGAVAPTQSVFTASDTPTTANVIDGPVQLGMKFQTNAAGWITGFSFYKGTSNTGTHTANLWTASGALLGSATFTNETASGWQYVELAQQVAVTANTTYVVSYNANSAYSATSNFFSTSRENQNLTALSSAVSGGNGVYSYGTGALFPTSTYNSTNYYVDVAFRPQLAA
ncbi:MULTISPECIES: DUF4082 domain-containing protein [Mesorhizobium]|uniref:DUF4082 domain-containing protein n=1 Tax=Mesorhizobium denitrificans TaxID=2294114 RepID=A0A371XH06_9HYPH|nr:MULTISPECIES: DUF4082 domain-containing protein [Mesorhizobium]RFC68498.1 DUF4082 domain-containing protein [Mesorhizobium denitrificans]